MGTGAYRIWADLAKNRLNIILNGKFSDDLVVEAVDKTISEAKKLKNGFAVINDISKFQPLSPAGLEHIKRAQLFVQNNGVKRIVRVISKQNITSKMQFTRMGREAYNKDADIAASFEEAEAILDMDTGREVQ